MKFVSLEVKGVVERGDACEIVEDDEQAEFFSIYGRDERGFAHCIGDFSSRCGAEEIKNALMSN
jgi:hypothetical protein